MKTNNSKYKLDMKALNLIKTSRRYLDYVEDHINNINQAFIQVFDACTEMPWFKNNNNCLKVIQDVEMHDLSKLSAEEFTQYRDKFYPSLDVCPIHSEYKINKAFSEAWENHKKCNSHHWESAETFHDIVHMVIDWTAMGYKFGDTAQEYYEANKDKINLKNNQIKFMYEIFDCLANKKNK